MSGETMAARHRLEPHQLARRPAPEELGFATTAEVEPWRGPVGQEQAMSALAMAVATEARGYNVFVVGRPGSGRRQAVLDRLRELAAARPAPPDWVYVHNFHEPDRPRLLQLPAGAARKFAAQMDAVVEAARREIPHAFEGEAYQDRRRAALADIDAERETVIQAMRRFAFERGFELEPGPGGFVMVPIVGGKPVSAEQAQNLPAPAREEIERRGLEVRNEAGGALRRLRELDRAATARVAELDRDVCLGALEPLFEPLRAEYAGNPDLIAHLADVSADMPDHAGDFVSPPQDAPSAPGDAPGAHLDRYRVNVFVTNRADDGAAVIDETNPTYYNLTGRIEYRGMFGFLTTDFRQVKAGALQRANGGYLVLDAQTLLSAPFAWPALKRALRTGEVRIENLGEQLSAVPTASQQPQPLPLDLKVVVIAPPSLHRLLLELDDEMAELFKVKAEFSPEMAWDAVHERRLAGFIARLVRERGLPAFEAAAVAVLIEHAGRLAEDQRHLSTQVDRLADLMSESTTLAAKAGRATVGPADVTEALQARSKRSNLIERRLDEAIDDGTIDIRTSGGLVGQLNGLTVLDLGDYRFSRPVRISAQVGLGRGAIESIERAIELSGPIHSKGVLTLSAYLAATHAQENPLPVQATLTFEQSYSEVDGDSASSAELYALLSALGDLPIDQGIAVTGSVNQHGRVQAVGGVTEKIEGFYRVCARAGLTGRQGVIIPSSNVRNLMLAPEVVEAVRGGSFHVWAVDHVDQGIEILTGVPAGRPGRSGRYPSTSVHGRVAARLQVFAERLRSSTVPAAPNGRPHLRRAGAGAGAKG